MPNTGPPNYTEVIKMPVYLSGSEGSGFNTLRVKAGHDLIKANDINELRNLIDIMYNHTHEYQDSIGSC